MHENLTTTSSTRSFLHGEMLQNSLVDRLNHDALLERVRLGNVTLAMIRPQVQKSVNFEADSEADARSVLEGSIAYLGVNTKFSMTLDEEAVAEFYADVVDRQRKKPPEAIYSMSSRWHEFQHLMTSGESTILLLESQDSNAVQRWRSQLGSWDIEGARDPSTLRGRFGINNHNNLFHGSDSPESVAKEIDIIKRSILRSKYEAPIGYYAMHTTQECVDEYQFYDGHS